MLPADAQLDVPPTVGEAFWQLPELMEDYGRARREAVWERIDPVLEGAAPEVTRVELDGYPPDSLVHHVRDVGAELLVLGTWGRGGLASLVLGSTSRQALHLAPCDVLIVKAPPS